MTHLGFSPHTRGCSYALLCRANPTPVFPAYAGMFRFLDSLHLLFVRFPRIRGDVPFAVRVDNHLILFSPHTRGCSSMNDFGRRRAQRFPRIRGDVPEFGSISPGQGGFSPHTRGCSASGNPAATLIGVFPAYAGMFLVPRLCGTQGSSFPRIRGDVPSMVGVIGAWVTFSPHTRGCSELLGHSSVATTVFPAYAGMFLLM